MLKYVSVAIALCLIGTTSHSEDKPDYAKLIVGKWEVTKSDPGTAPEGSIIEFMKEGKAKATLKINDKTDTIEGTYSLDGEKLKVKFGERENDGLIITKISQTEMSVKDKDGKELMMKRMK